MLNALYAYKLLYIFFSYVPLVRVPCCVVLSPFFLRRSLSFFLRRSLVIYLAHHLAFFSFVDRMNKDASSLVGKEIVIPGLVKIAL